MLTKRLVLLFLFIGLPTTLWADASSLGLPDTSQWYFHADFDEMRNTEAGKHLYSWLDGEVFEEIRDEIGVDLSKEANQITAFAEREDALIVIVDGTISQESRDKVLAIGALSGNMDELEAGGDTYYYVRESHEDTDQHDYGHDHDDHGVEIGDSAYFSFAVKNKMIVTTNEADMKAMLASNGKIARKSGNDGALLILGADRSLLQAGLNTDELDEDLGFDSNIIRNAEQVALLIADEAGKLAIEAQLLASDAGVVEGLASIVRGLISLQIFNDELDPEISSVLQSTTVNVDGRRLRLKVTLDPEVVIAAME